MKHSLYVGSVEQAKQLVNASVDQSFNLCINIGNGQNKKTNFEILDYLAENWGVFGENIKKVNILVDYEKLPKGEFLHLAKFNDRIKQTSTECVVTVNHDYFSKGEEIPISKTWTVETIIKANSEIERVCEFIRVNNLSPMEALAFIHNYVANVAKYNPTDRKHILIDANDQFFAGAYMDLPEVICMGFCDLEKEIIDTLNMKGLSCDIISVEFKNYKKGYVDDHARCFVNVADKKYGIFQNFFDDPTWDNPEENEGPRYTHYCMPLDCMERKNNGRYDYYHPDIFEFSNCRTTRALVDFEWSQTHDNSDAKVDQLMIEKIHMKILTLVHKNWSFEKVYQTLIDMAVESFEEQESRDYYGYFNQNLPLLSTEEAKKIYDENLSKENTIEK